MTREFYDGAMENMPEQQFNMPMYQGGCGCSDYDEDDDFENETEDVFAEFEDYPNEGQRYPVRYDRPYPVRPIYPMYPIYRHPYYRRPIYRKHPMYPMHPMYPTYPRRNF
jgi:hypothetical protein